MKLSVLVLTHNRLETLKGCLSRIAMNTVAGSHRVGSENNLVGDAEIIVVDNASTDGTRDWMMNTMTMNVHDDDARTFELFGMETEYIPLATNEFVCARNHGIRAAAGDYILQVDDDVAVSPGWDRVLLMPMEVNPMIGAVGQEAFYQQSTWERGPRSAGLIDDRRRPQPGQFSDFVMGFCWAWRADRVTGLHTADERIVGASQGEPRFLYDEQFNPFWHEESDLQLQIRAAGYRIAVVPNVATHLSLPHIRDRAEDLDIAERNFNRLRDKWQHDPRIRYEGREVGL